MDSCDCDTACYDGPIEIRELTVGCEDYQPNPALGGDLWTWELWAVGHVGTATVEIAETGDAACWPDNPAACWSESHALSLVERYACRDGDSEWDLEVDNVAAPQDQVSGATTLFDCLPDSLDQGVPRALAMKFTIFDEAGVEIECAIAGYQSHQYWNVLGGADCLCFEHDRDCSN